jgi:hypothetical protein
LFASTKRFFGAEKQKPEGRRPWEAAMEKEAEEEHSLNSKYLYHDESK